MRTLRSSNIMALDPNPRFTTVRISEEKILFSMSESNSVNKVFFNRLARSDNSCRTWDPVRTGACRRPSPYLTPKERPEYRFKAIFCSQAAPLNWTRGMFPKTRGQEHMRKPDIIVITHRDIRSFPLIDYPCSDSKMFRFSTRSALSSCVGQPN